MSSDNITITLPDTEQAFWVFTIGFTLICLSVLAFHLGHKRIRKNGPSNRWLANTLVVFAGILAPIWAALILLVLYGLWQIAWTFPHASPINETWLTKLISPSANSENDLRWHVLALVGLLTALGGLLATPLAMLRVHMTERQTKATEEGHITDRINKAVEGLGAEKTGSRIGRIIRFQDETGDTRQEIKWAGGNVKRKPGDTILEEGIWQVFNETAPNLEVRIGALYALERISQDSERDHIQIMEILCAYIRQNAARNRPALPEIDLTPEQWRIWGAMRRAHADLDVDIALRIIGRRSAERKTKEESQKFRLDLERVTLRAADLRNRSLSKALLSTAHLQGALLWGADLQGADLRGAQLQGCNLRESNLQGANLKGADLRGANLFMAKFDKGTVLTDVNVWGASLRGVDLSDCNVSIEQIKTAFGDASTILPGGVGPGHANWPPHWPNEILNLRDYTHAWSKWAS